MLKQVTALWKRLVTLRPTNNVQEDRRVWVRYPARTDAQVKPATAEDTGAVNAKVLDVSRGGVRLLVDRPYEEGALISLDLPDSGDEASGVAVLACVVRAERHSTGIWMLGCNFSRELDAHDLQWFGIAKARPSEPDQRGWSRFECPAQAFYTVTNAEASERRPAKVANLSVGGVALLVDCDVPNGTMLGVELLTAAGVAVTNILACVVHVSGEVGCTRALGCNFICDLSEEHLNTLLFQPQR